MTKNLLGVQDIQARKQVLRAVPKGHLISTSYVCLGLPRPIQKNRPVGYRPVTQGPPFDSAMTAAISSGDCYGRIEWRIAQ